MKSMLMICFILLLDISFLIEADPVEIQIDSGLIQGRRVDSEQGIYDEFLGVPFAKPPVGNLRWQKPAPVTPWQGVLNATAYSRHCTHFVAPLYPLIGVAGGQHGEDCLYLNVWVPNGVDPEANLPVMVFYFGGAFFIGTGEMYPGNVLALEGNVIVVNFNYRLSTLGWLASGDDVLPGNYGLWDSRAALQWVQSNIGQFGGDRNRVTIFGQSAGAAMVSHSVVSPQFEGLFQRAIAISGGSSSFFGLTRQPRTGLLAMSEFFSCNATDSQEIVDCLMDFNAEMLDFWGIVGEIVLRNRLPLFVPVIDGEIVIGEPVELYAQGYGSDIDFITGSNYHDAAGLMLLNPLATRALGDTLNRAATPERWDSFIRFLLSFAANSQELIDVVYHLYPDLNTADNMTRTLAATQWGNDLGFHGPTFYEASQHSKFAETAATYHYKYHFRHSFLAGYPDWIEGSHIDDLYTIFGDVFMDTYRQLFLRVPWFQRDYDIHKNWAGYLSNFAHTGNPNEGEFQVPVQWPQMTEANEQLVLSSDISVDNIDESQTALYDYLVVHFPEMVERPDLLQQKINSEELASKAANFLDQLFGVIEDEELLLKIKEITEKFIPSEMHNNFGVHKT